MPRATAVVLAGLTILAGCGGDPGPPRQEATGSPDAPEQAPQTFEPRDVLEAGTYLADTFDPPFTFRIEGESAIASSAEAGHMDLGFVTSDPSFRLIVHQVREVFDPEARAFVATPDDLVAWLQQNPMVETGDPEEAEVGGTAATRIDVSLGSGLHTGAGCLAANPCAPLFRAEEGQPLHIHEEPQPSFLQAPLRLFVVTVDGRTIVFAIDTDAPLDEVDPAAEDVLQGIAF